MLLLSCRVASAPGKVLMTGGYLILERPNGGIVLSTNARFYAIVKPLYEETKPDSWAWVCIVPSNASVSNITVCLFMFAGCLID